MTLVYSVTTPEIDTVYTYWARCNDFAAGDFVSSGNAGLVTVADSRYVVRRDPYWVEGVRFTDETGDTRTVQGVSEFRRNSDHSVDALVHRGGDLSCHQGVPSKVVAQWCRVQRRASTGSAQVRTVE